MAPKTGFRIYSRRDLHICAFRSVAMPSFSLLSLTQQIAFSLLLISDENRQEIGGGRQSSLNSLFILSASCFALLLFFRCEAHESHDCLFFNCNYTLKVLWKWKKTSSRLVLCSGYLAYHSALKAIMKRAANPRQTIAFYSRGRGLSWRHTTDCLSRKEIDQFEFWRGDQT